MILYTNQSLDFDICKDECDLSKSEYYTELGFKKAYNYLFDILKNDKFIWSSGIPYVPNSRSSRSIKKYSDPYRMWVLDVPDFKIIALNRYIWDSVICDWYHIDYDALKQLMSGFSLNSSYSEYDLEDDIFEVICNKIPDKTVTYSNLIRKNRKEWDTVHDDFLIPSPIKKKWVVCSHIVTEENPKRRK